MPNIPSHGAAGGHNVGDKPTAGPQEHGPNAPSHGAAGGYDIDFDAVKDGVSAPTSTPPNKPMPGIPIA